MFHLICPLPTQIVIAYSGGIDSTAALHYLATQCKNKYQVSAYHYNHRLRPQNDIMEQKVSWLCSRFGVPLVIKRREVFQGKYTEASLRQLRIQYYLDNALNVVTAHQLRDAVEQEFLCFLTGKQRRIPIPIKTDFGNGTTIYHPFLTTDKQRFIDYVKKHKLEEFVEEDETNKDVSVGRRNMTREIFLPLINEKFNVGLDKIIRKRYLSEIKRIKQEVFA